MKQDQDTRATGDSSDRPQPSVKRNKPEKNLYEPYSTPRLLYELLRWFAILVFSLVTHIHLRGRYNVPRKGPYIIASNHLSCTDIPLVPMFIPGKVVYMAKEEAFDGRLGWL